MPPPPSPPSSSSSSSSSTATPAALPSPAPPTPGEETIMQAIEDESFLYPTLDDPNFNIKIAEKREFADTTYEGKVYDSMQKIKEYANKMCNADFELSPHQMFVRNFLSIQTPTIVCFYIMVSAQAKHVLQLRFAKKCVTILSILACHLLKKLLLLQVQTCSKILNSSCLILAN